MSFNLRRLKHSKAGKNALAAYFSFISVSISGILSISIAVAYLNREEIGLWTAVNAMITYLLWMDLGIGYATGRMIAKSVVENDQNEMNAWWTITQIALWAIGIAIMISGLLSTPLFISLFNVPEKLHHEAWILLGGSAIITGLNLPLRAVTGLLTAQERFHWVSICQGIMPWIQVLGFYVMISRGYGITSYLWGTTLSQIFVLVYYKTLEISYHQRPHLTLSGLHISKFKVLMSYSLKMTIINLKDTLLQNLPTIILARLGGLSIVPVYSITSRGPSIASSLAIRNMHAFYPELVNLHVSGQKDLFLKKHLLTSYLTLCVSCLAAAGVLLLNRTFVETVAGGDFYAGSVVTTWFAIGAIVLPMCAVYSWLLQISGKLSMGPIVALLSIAITIPSAVLAYQIYGMSGIAAIICLEPILFAYYGLYQGAKNSSYRVADFSIKPIFLGIFSCLIVFTCSTILDTVTISGLSIKIGNKILTLPGIYHFAAITPLLLLAASIARLTINLARNKTIS